jgi:hypothetical protein
MRKLDSNLQHSSRAITWRALLLGTSSAVFVNIASPYTESVGFSNFSWSYLPEGAVIPFLTIFVFNLIFAKFYHQWALTSKELAIIFIMALVSNSTSLFLIYFFLAAIVSPHYFASPENEWREYLLPYIPKKLIVQNTHHAVDWFYEGMPKGAPLPWREWTVPLAFWLPLFFAILLASYVLIAVFRKQWIEREKLAYPLMQPIIQILDESPHPTSPPSPLHRLVERGGGEVRWRQPLFFLGVAIPLFLATSDTIHRAIPAFPAMPIDHLGSLNWGGFSSKPGLSSLVLCINFIAIGAGYFVPQDVLFSVWFLYVFIKVIEVYLLSRFGRLYIGSAGMFVWGDAAIAWQSFGAFVVFVLVMILWRAKRHLKQIFISAFTGQNRDPEELMTPRAAMLIFAFCLVFIVFWLWYSGLPMLVITIFLPLLLLIYLGLSRVVCQSGIFYVVPPMIAQNPCIYLLSARRIGAQGMVALGLTYSWHGDVQTILPALSAEGAKLQPSAACSGRQITAAIILTIIVGLLVAPWGVILTGYRHGAINWNTWLFQGFGPSTYGQVISQIQYSADTGFEIARFIYFSTGAFLMLILTILHYRFLWWPIHPVGLAVISSFTMYTVYVGFFIAWAAKSFILRWGGFKAYRSGIPFFIGLLVGHYAGRAIALVSYTVLGLRFL